MRLDQTLRFAEYGLLPVELQQSENCKLILSNPRQRFPLWSVSVAASATAYAAPSRRRNRRKIRNAERRYPSR